MGLITQFKLYESSQKIKLYWGVAKPADNDGGFDFILYPLSQILPAVSWGPDTSDWDWWEDEDAEGEDRYPDEEEAKEEYLLNQCTTKVYGQVFLVAMSSWEEPSDHANGLYVLENYTPPVPSLMEFLNGLREKPDIIGIAGFRAKSIVKLATPEIYKALTELPDSLGVLHLIKNRSPRFWEALSQFGQEDNETGAALGGYGF